LRHNYAISIAGKDGVFGTKDDIHIRVARVRYESSNSAVSLFAGRRLPPHRAIQVNISGSIRTVYGLFLNGSGQKSGSDVTINLPAKTMDAQSKN
jgi:hypothetical protein